MGESFSLLPLNTSLRHVRDDITASLEANHGPICYLQKCDVQPLSLQCTHTENAIFSEGEDILC